MGLHHYYDQLTDKEREAVDQMATVCFATARAYTMVLDGSDPAERAVDALSRWVIESRESADAQIDDVS
jgi:hypothetical protein